MSNFDDDKNLSPEDQALWDEFARDLRDEVEGEELESFKELLDKDVEMLEESPPSKEEEQGVIEQEIKRAKQKKSKQPPQLDKRTEEKLRKGKIPIEARLDLHGMNREVAHEKLEHFIIGSYNRGLRLVIIITGKGKSKSTTEDWLTVGSGVLKTNVPFWLKSTKLRPYILKYMNAQPKDGGTGALYVYLKRNRN